MCLFSLFQLNCFLVLFGPKRWLSTHGLSVTIGALLWCVRRTIDMATNLELTPVTETSISVLASEARKNPIVSLASHVVS